MVTRASESKRANRVKPAILVLATALALLNALIGISSLSFARDEGFTVSTALRSWPSLFHLLLTTETNGWPYSIMLRAWSVLGIGPGVLRTLSAIAFAATVPTAAWIAGQLFGRRAAALTAFGIAVNGALLMYAQQMRSYAVAVLLATAATAVFVAEVRRPSRRTWLGWVLLLTLTAACQLQMFTLVAAHLLALWALPARDRQWRRRLAAAALAFALTLPMTIAVLSHEEGQGLLGWRLGVFKDILLTMTGRSLILGTLAFGAAGIYLLARLRRSWFAERVDDFPDEAHVPPAPDDDRFALALVASWATVPFACMLVVSLVQPTLIGRYLLFCVPAVVIALAVLVDQLWSVGPPRRLQARVVAVLMGIAAASGSVAWHVGSGTEHWNEATAHVFANASAGDRLVVGNDSIRLFFEYERRLIGEQASTPSNPEPGFPAQPWGEYGTGDQLYRSATAAELEAVAADAQRIWLVWGADHLDSEVMPGYLTQLTGAGWKQVEHRSYEGQLEVYLLSRG